MSGLNDDLIAFFSSLKTYVNLTTRAGLQEDPNMREHLCFKLEDYLQVVRTLTSIVNSKAGHEELKSLLGRLVWELQELLNELQSQVRQDTQHNNFRLNKQCDTGGRPKYVVTKEQIETLRDTGMNWKSVAQVLGISERTLFRRREEFNMEDTFSNISDTDLKAPFTVFSSKRHMLGKRMCEEVWLLAKFLYLGIGYANVFVHLILSEEQ